MLTKEQIIGLSGDYDECKTFADIYGFARAIEALVRAECVPPGFVVVPVEPTDAMLDAASRASMQHLLDCINDPKLARKVGSEAMTRKTHASRYRTMLAAAPGITAPTAKDNS